jgi:8-oxo-dGTP pyrophosphatase MutT (NUDIX family)
MNPIISAGIVVYRLCDGRREYLIIRNRKGHWDFPKGKQEPGETVLETAMRELYEETGLTVANPYGPLQPISWTFKERGIAYHKQGIFFIGRVDEYAAVTLSPEHDQFLWLAYAQACEKLHHRTSQTLLAEVQGTIEHELETSHILKKLQ